MGNFSGNASVPNPSAWVPATIQHYFSTASWIEGAALDQLQAMSRLRGARRIAAFPDLHPGKYGATGVALLADRLHPLLIGNDIGCGMALFELDLPVRKLKLDKAAGRLRRFDDMAIEASSERLESIGLPRDLHAEALGTIGGGNHFCELQAVESLGASHAGIDRQNLYLLVHSGSRGFGASVFADVLTHEPDLTSGLDATSAIGQRWLGRHDDCVAWASLNRSVIAEKAAAALGADFRLVADVPHNLVRRREDGYVHHKGSAAVSPGDIAPIAGSRASLSYVVRATVGVADALGGLSHGAGRKYDRATMHGRVGLTRAERDGLLRNGWGGIAICDDRNLVIEEASFAYKDAGQAVADLEVAGLVEKVAALRPLITYKKAVDASDNVRRLDKHGHRRTGRREHDRG